MRSASPTNLLRPTGVVGGSSFESGSARPGCGDVDVALIIDVFDSFLLIFFVDSVFDFIRGASFLFSVVNNSGLFFSNPVTPNSNLSE